jgi:hypothetical protein
MSRRCISGWRLWLEMRSWSRLSKSKEHFASATDRQAPVGELTLKAPRLTAPGTRGSHDHRDELLRARTPIFRMSSIRPSVLRNTSAGDPAGGESCIRQPGSVLSTHRQDFLPGSPRYTRLLGKGGEPVSARHVAWRSMRTPASSSATCSVSARSGSASTHPAALRRAGLSRTIAREASVTRLCRGCATPAPRRAAQRRLR